jgi:hypothetical protein
MDPAKVIDQGKQDYIIQFAMMKKALDIRAEEKIQELKIAAELTAVELAKVMGNIF